MTKHTASKILTISILVIVAMSIISSLVNLPTIEKTMAATCIDTPFCNTPHKEFSFGRLHIGDCTLQWATFYLLPRGQGQLEAYVTSTSSSDSWGFKNIHFTGSQSFNIGDLWSPTLPREDPNISSTGPNWVAHFTYNGDYRLVNHVNLNYHC